MKHYRVLSLDIWDTVLRRKCHPDEIKLATARYLYLTEYQKLKPDCRDVQKLLIARLGAERFIASHHELNEDDEYSIRDVFMRSLEEVLADKDQIHHIVENLYKAELNKELDMVYLDPNIIETISQISYDKLGYISDFYAGTEFIDALLEKVKFPLEMQFCYISCEHRLNKRSGRLFAKFLSDMKISGAEQLHIGDNVYSDCEVPQDMGINTRCYQPDIEQKKRKSKESYYSLQNGHDLELICKDLYKGKATADILAPFFTNFVLWILEDCARRNIKQIYYFTREGEFFIQLHDVIVQSGLIPASSVPEARTLEVSRLSTFAPSLRQVSLDELMRLWNQYSIQSMSAFEKSVALDEGKMSPWLERYEIPIDEMITYPWLDERVQRLFQDSEFVSFFQQHIDEKKSLLIRYCGQKKLGISPSKDVAVVDIGWRGTIQDNLCYLFPENKFIGYYLALEQFLNPQPINAEKYGFINNESHYQYLLRIVSPIEMLCNSPYGSTTGYVMENENCVALRKKEPAEDHIFDTYTHRVQQEILKKAVNCCEQIGCHSLMSSQLQKKTYERFSGILLNPQQCREFPTKFFHLQHNEEFGVGRYVNKKLGLRLDLMLMALVSKKSRGELKKFLMDTSWPQGYLARYYMDPLIPILNKKLGVI